MCKCGHSLIYHGDGDHCPDLRCFAKGCTCPNYVTKEKR